MHRSGTSLASQLLREAGFDFGKSGLLYPADRWNMRGYIETEPILDLNSIFITGVPRTKSRAHALLNQCIYMTMPQPERVYRRGLKHERDIRQTGKIYDKLAVKDPRFCLTLPLWSRFANIDKVVVCIRHPNAVARSLWRRQALPRPLSLRFWCYHIRALLECLPAGRTCFFDVDKLVAGEGIGTFTSVLRFLEADLDRAQLQQVLDHIFHGQLMRPPDTARTDLPAKVRLLWDRLESTARECNEPLLVDKN